MSILIKGMKLPKEGNWKTVRIYPDGTCAVPNWQGDCTLIKGVQAFPVPDHGRLIDADAVQDEWYRLNFDRKISDGTLAYWNMQLSKAPTIIEAEEGER